eukprot:64609-Chlamydomonas_euryale.AAC.4
MAEDLDTRRAASDRPARSAVRAAAMAAAAPHLRDEARAHSYSRTHPITQMELAASMDGSGCASSGGSGSGAPRNSGRACGSPSMSGGAAAPSVPLVPLLPPPPPAARLQQHASMFLPPTLQLLHGNNSTAALRHSDSGTLPRSAFAARQQQQQQQQVSSGAAQPSGAVAGSSARLQMHSESGRPSPTESAGAGYLGTSRLRHMSSHGRDSAFLPYADVPHSGGVGGGGQWPWPATAAVTLRTSDVLRIGSSGTPSLESPGSLRSPNASAAAHASGGQAPLPPLGEGGAPTPTRLSSTGAPGQRRSLPIGIAPDGLEIHEVDEFTEHGSGGNSSTDGGGGGGEVSARTRGRGGAGTAASAAVAATHAGSDSSNESLEHDPFKNFSFTAYSALAQVGENVPDPHQGREGKGKGWGREGGV